jgi:hypothetical protein
MNPFLIQLGSHFLKPGGSQQGNGRGLDVWFPYNPLNIESQS